MIISFVSLAHVGSIAALLATSQPSPKPQAPRCSVVYINGDAVISCPKGSR